MSAAWIWAEGTRSAMTVATAAQPQQVLERLSRHPPGDQLRQLGRARGVLGQQRRLVFGDHAAGRPESLDQSG